MRVFARMVSLVASAMFLAPLLVRGSSLGPWVTEPPTLNSIVQGDNGFVTAAAGGQLLFSPDAYSWTTTAASNTNELTALAYGNGTYVAVGNGGTILSSTDGSNWTVQGSGTSYDLHAIDFADAIFVAVGAKGTMVTSADGSQWTAVQVPGLPSFADLYAVKFGGGVFVAGGVAYAATSTDGITWTANFSGLSGAITSLAYGGGQFVAYLGYDVGTSPDGVTWTEQTADTFNHIQMYALASTANTFAIVGDFGAVFTSPDGQTWTSYTAGVSGGLRGLVALGGSFYAVGDKGTVVTSTTATNWTVLTTSVGNASQLNGIAAGNGVFAAVGEPAVDGPGKGQAVIQTSPDGVIWTPRSSGTSNHLSSVIYAKDRFIAVGSQSTAVILSSPDGAAWSRYDLPADSVPYMATYGNNLFVVVGTGPNGGMALTSSDGVTWTANSSDLPPLFAVAFVNNIFVAAGLGTILTSADGLQWTPQFQDAGFSLFFTGVAYGNGAFVVVGNQGFSSQKNGIIMSSADGVTWTRGQTNTYDRLSDVKFVRDTFYTAGWLVGEYASAGILASTNGLSWLVQSNSVHTGPLQALASDNQRIVAVGQFGTILRSEFAAAPQVPAFGGFSATTRTPILSRNPWQFSATLSATNGGLTVRVQSTLAPNDEGTWTDLPSNADMSQQGNAWALNTTGIPLGIRYFRAIAAASNVQDRVSNVIGPFTVQDQPQLPPFTSLGYATTSPYLSTNVWSFSVYLSAPSSAPGLQVRMQFSLTPAIEVSWSDLPSGAGMTAAGTGWTLNTTDVPVGNDYFRAVASAPGYQDQVGSALGPLNVQAEPQLPPFGSFSYSTTAPIRSSNPWSFSADLASTAAGLRVRVQSSFAPAIEASWADMPAGASMAVSGTSWTLDTMDIPVGTVSFRAVASAPGFLDRISLVSGPATVLQGIGRLDDFTALTTLPHRTGTYWTFTVVEDSLLSDLRLRIQSSPTPGTESSWSDLPGGGQMGHAESTWLLITTNLPTGTISFRVVASAPDYADRISGLLGPLTISASWPQITQTFTGHTTYALKDISAAPSAEEIVCEAVEIAEVYILFGDLDDAVATIKAGLVMLAQQGSAITVTIGSGHTLNAPGVSIGSGASLVLAGPVNGDVALLGPSASALISQDGSNLSSAAALVSHDGGSLAAVSGASLQSQTSLPLISQHGNSVVSNDGGSVISNDGGSAISHDGASLTGPGVATFTSKGGSNSRGDASAVTAQPKAMGDLLQPSFTGVMTINGNYSQGPGTGLIIAIAGTNTLSSGAQQYDQLNISGRADLSGVIAFGLFDPANQTNQAGYFSPPAGATFDVVVATNISVHHLTVRGPIWGDGLHFNWSVVTRDDGLQALRLLAVEVRPLLVIQNLGSTAQLLYPTNYLGYVLQGSAALLPGNWSPISSGTNLVNFPSTNSTAFFRLVRP